MKFVNGIRIYNGIEMQSAEWRIEQERLDAIRAGIDSGTAYVNNEDAKWRAAQIEDEINHAT